MRWPIALSLVACGCAPAFSSDDERHLLSFASCIGQLEGLRDITVEGKSRILSEARRAAEPSNLTVYPFLEPAADQLGDLMETILPDVPPQVAVRMTEKRISTRERVIANNTHDTATTTQTEVGFDATEQFLVNCRDPVIEVSKIDGLERHFAPDQTTILRN